MFFREHYTKVTLNGRVQAAYVQYQIDKQGRVTLLGLYDAFPCCGGRNAGENCSCQNDKLDFVDEDTTLRIVEEIKTCPRTSPLEAA